MDVKKSVGSTVIRLVGAVTGGGEPDSEAWEVPQMLAEWR